jgi:L-ribulose-5-phosphate 4-epimerase
MLLSSLREQVLETALQMVRDGIAHGAQGNISFFDRESRLVVITPSAIPYAHMKVEDICVIDLDGNPVESLWKSTSETRMHLIFYQKSNDVGAVVHSHAPYATLFGIVRQSIPMVLTEAAACLTGAVPIAPYAQAGSQELANIVFETIGDGAAVVLANHGLLTTGRTLEQAYDATLAAETTARLVWMAQSMGKQVFEVPSEECRLMREMYLNHYKPYQVKK